MPKQFELLQALNRLWLSSHGETLARGDGIGLVLHLAVSLLEIVNVIRSNCAAQSPRYYRVMIARWGAHGLTLEYLGFVCFFG